MQSHSGFKQFARQTNLSIAMGVLKAGDILPSI
jgi:hypothetical protein